MAAPPADPHLNRVRDRLVVLLAVNSGVTDAFAFLSLGGAFTSVMTGNMVLFGISLARPSASLAVHTLAAILCFVGGCALGARLTGAASKSEPVWPATVSRALRVQFAVVLIATLSFEVRPHGSEGLQLAILAANALALGVQSSAVQKFGVSGLSTTYLTGTLTSLVIRLSTGKGIKSVQHSAQLLAGLIGGAAVGTLLTRHVERLTPAFSLVCLGLALLGGERLRRRSESA